MGGNGQHVFLGDPAFISKSCSVHKQLLAFDFGHAILMRPNEKFQVDDSLWTRRSVYIGVMRGE
jgi:hypothetical protein